MESYKEIRMKNHMETHNMTLKKQRCHMGQNSCSNMVESEGKEVGRQRVADGMAFWHSS
jgi:hypothetical protein